MRKFYIAAIAAAAFVGACSSTATNNANIRGTNTNTGYVTNSETNAKPTIPANATNIQPPSVGNANSNVNHSNSNSNVNTHK